VRVKWKVYQYPSIPSRQSASRNGREREVHPNQPIPRARREVLAIRGETDRPDVRISLLGHVSINEPAAERTSAHVKNLGGMIAPSGEPQTVLAKPDAMHVALVVDLEHEADVERPG